jgi:cytoskeletal protein CcmA (bactofilin family)
MADYGSIRQSWKRVVVAERWGDVGPVADDSPVEEAPRPRGTFVGSGAIFEGALTLKGDFEIDTEFRGELETDGAITIGLQGSVVGSIRAREVVIRGAVVGNVHAPRQLVIESTGKVHGDIETACLEIQKHAFFRGSTSMTQPQASRRLASSSSPEADPSFAPL